MNLTDHVAPFEVDNIQYRPLEVTIHFWSSLSAYMRLFNESRMQLPGLSLESGHGITSLQFSEACTGFRSGYAYSTSCACLCTWCAVSRSPAYLADMMTATADLPGRERLRSANSFRYETPKLKLKFGERGFSYAGPKGVELTSFQSPGTNEHWYL